MTQTTAQPAGLRACLVGLVLLNLVFVHVTGAVSFRSLAPLYLLTLAAPLLIRLRESLMYRLAWNGSVLVIFTLLVQHASQGIHLLLEDGLMLAAFCQVHLINNLSREQKPDLLFFNSFLIALVTSFFCQDVTYAAIFAVYAALVLLAMQLACAADSRIDAPRLLGDGSTKAAVTLAATMAVFFVWPRDFDRPGLVTDHLIQSAVNQVDFSENVELGRSGKTVLSNRVVMRIRLESGAPEQVPLHWRGATFDMFDDGRWKAVTDRQGFGGPLDSPWVHRDNGVRRPARRTTAEVEVTLDEREGARLFAPLTSHRLTLPPGLESVYVTTRIDNTLGVIRGYNEPDPPRLRYSLRLHAQREDHGDRQRHRPRAALLPFQQVTRRDLGAAGVELAARLAREVGARAPHRDVVDAFRSYLAEHYTYMLPGTQGAAGSLPEFLAGDAGGHCEFFATALALMLRSEGLPCRLVTGYMCSEWNEARTEITVRRKHAHAWVEVRDPAGFWYAADASPVSDVEDALAEESLASHVSAWFGSVWSAVATFDGDRHAAALAWLRAAPGRAVRWAGNHPAQGVAAATAAAAALWWLRSRRRRRQPPAITLYLRAVGRTGLRPNAGETPRELLARAQREGVRPARIAQLESATAAHEAARYGVG